MRLLWVRVKGYIGIYQGTGLRELYIDFRKQKNRIVMIEGRNGGGKTTLLDLLNPYPDSNDCFINGEPAEKEIAYMNKGTKYILNFDHPITSAGARATTRAYIKKQTENGMTEYNPTGNVTTFKDVLDAEFGLDPNFIILSRMSTEDRGIVDKTPGERKKFISKIIEQVEVYNNIQKVLVKRSSLYKSLMNNIVAKIDSIGDEESLILALKSIDNRLAGLKARKDVVIKNISDAQAMINVLDPDLSIQNLYSSIQVELEGIDLQIKQYQSNIEYLYSKGLNNLLTLDQCAKLYSDNGIMITKYESLIEQVQSSMNDMLISREEENRAMQLKVQRLNSLKSELDFVDIQKSIKMYKDNIKEYEKFFDNIKIKNAISISKDEYVSGLHILKDIKDMVDNFRSYCDNQIILDAVDSIRANENVVSMQSKNSNELDEELKLLGDLTNQYSYYSGLLSKLDILNNRPKKCKIDSCAFIKDSLDALSQDPKNKMIKLQKQIDQCNERIEVLEKTNTNMINRISYINDINIILRNIKNNSAILNKLPNGHMFSNQEEFLNRLYNGDTFNDIDELYQYIGYANIFEEYKIAKDSLYKLETDYKIYESKNEVIEELSKDIDNINNKLINIASKIEDANNSIRDYKEKLLKLKETQESLNIMISIFKKKEEAEYKKQDNITKLNAISSNMEKIKIYLNAIDVNTSELNSLNNEISPIEADRDRIKYGITMIKDYNKELKEYTKSYNLIEVLKTYSSPSKKGIQNLFIKVYMSNTINLANELLSYLFSGRMRLLPYNIGDGGEFAIPCLSMNTGMVTDDVSSCSRSEKSMISTILGFVLLRQSATVYNILKLDEIDEGLDSHNRIIFIDTLNKLLDLLEVEQCIMISHSPEHTGEYDVIKLAQPENSVSVSNGNVIFSLE